MQGQLTKLSDRRWVYKTGKTRWSVEASQIDPNKPSIFKCSDGNCPPMFVAGTIDDAVAAMDTGPTAIVPASRYIPMPTPNAPAPRSSLAPLDRGSPVHCLWAIDVNGYASYEHAPFGTGSLDSLMLAMATRYGSMSNIAVAFAAITPVSANVYEGTWQKVNMALWRLSGNSNGMSVGGAQP